MTGRGRSLFRQAGRAVRTVGGAVRRLWGSVRPPMVWLGVAGGLAAAGWLLVQPAGAPGGAGVLVPFGSVGDLARVGCAALAGSLAILLLGAGGVAVDPSPRRGRREDLLRLWVGCVVVVVLLVVLCDVAGAAAVVTGQQAPPPPAPVSTAPDLDTVLNNARNWLMGILATVATFFFTLGAARYGSAGGDPGEVERAKGAFRNAAIGYSLAVLAPLVLKALRSVVGA